MTIWVVRHADTEWTATGQHTGRTDLPLTAAGRRAAEALRERLDRPSWAQILTSPLRRARDTCRLAGLEGAECEHLLEWDYGAYEGRTTAEIRAERADWDLWRHGCPDGEDAGAVGARADVLLASLPTDGDVLVFSHGHLLRVLTARWLGLEPSGGALFALAPGGVGILGWERDRRVLRGWG
ncbi:MAG: histidine phosphatase family protein [Solirubrobacteraceae bacterium]